MWLYKCPICKSNIDFDYDDNTIPTEDEMYNLFDNTENECVIKGEMWCPKCHKRYNFAEHWTVKLNKFIITEIEY